MAGSIEGKVINQATGEPIEGAAVELKGEGEERETKTDGKGAFAARDLPTPDHGQGRYDGTVTKDGFEPGIYAPIVVVEGNATEIVCALQPKAV